MMTLLAKPSNATCLKTDLAAASTVMWNILKNVDLYVKAKLFVLRTPPSLMVHILSHQLLKFEEILDPVHNAMWDTRTKRMEMQNGGVVVQNVPEENIGQTLFVGVHA